MAEIACQAFALCENAATGVIAHPILDYVPCCERCARRLESELIPAEFTEETA